MNQCRQTKINQGFSLIVDDSGHRKSGNFTEVVGRGVAELAYDEVVLRASKITHI